MLDKKAKERVMKKFKIHESDTGSSSVQIAILTEEIKQLTKHLKEHKKDFSSRRGLLKKVSERRKLLNYLRREDSDAFISIVETLKLKAAMLKVEKDKKEEELLAEEMEVEAKGEKQGKEQTKKEV